jgi:hypothetical protein
MHSSASHSFLLSHTTSLLCSLLLLLSLLSPSQLGSRLSHVVRRLLPISLHLLQRDSQLPSGHELFLSRLSSTYNNFIEEVSSKLEREGI